MTKIITNDNNDRKHIKFANDVKSVVVGCDGRGVSKLKNRFSTDISK